MTLATLEPVEVGLVEQPHVRSSIERHFDDVAAIRLEGIVGEVHFLPFRARFGAACDKALPTAVLGFPPVRPSRNIVDAAFWPVLRCLAIRCSLVLGVPAGVTSSTQSDEELALVVQRGPSWIEPISEVRRT